MSMLLKMSWRNLWRNRKRTAITAVALVIALVLMIVYNGLTRGVSRQLQRTITHVTIGDYQIHHRQYLQELSIYDSLIDYQRLLENLRQRHLTAAPRWYGYGLIANDKTMKSVGVEIQAVDLKLEPQVSDLPRAENFLQGQYLKAGSNKNEIVLGKKVAEALTVKVGDPLVLVTTAADGSIGNEMFQVVGILKSIGDTWDRTRVIMEQGSFMRLFAFPADQAHEIAIRTDGVKFSRTQQSELETILPAQAEIKSWSELVPLIADMVAMVEVITTILMIIVYLSAGLVVLNSILMMVFERTREIGIMKALGYGPVKIVVMIIVETTWLTMVAITFGLLLGYGVNSYLITSGIDLSRFAANGYDFSGTTIDPCLHSINDAIIFWRPTLLLLLITLISALYPSIKAARLNPIQAIYKRG